MSVYVDPVIACIPNRNWRWKEVSHLFADTDAELHALAAKIGLRRDWHQPRPPASLSHYDLTPNVRQKALQAGAIELDRRAAVNHWRKARGEEPLEPPHA